MYPLQTFTNKRILNFYTMFHCFSMYRLVPFYQKYILASGENYFFHTQEGRKVMYFSTRPVNFPQSKITKIQITSIAVEVQRVWKKNHGKKIKRKGRKNHLVVFDPQKLQMPLRQNEPLPACLLTPFYAQYMCIIYEQSLWE